MLPKEVNAPLGDIGKKNPVLSLLLTLLILGVVALYWRGNRKESMEAKRCADSEARAWAMVAKERAEKDSIISENNRDLKERLRENEIRKASQDSAIKAINQLKK